MSRIPVFADRFQIIDNSGFVSFAGAQVGSHIGVGVSRDAETQEFIVEANFLECNTNGEIERAERIDAPVFAERTLPEAARAGFVSHFFNKLKSEGKIAALGEKAVVISHKQTTEIRREELPECLLPENLILLNIRKIKRGEDVDYVSEAKITHRSLLTADIRSMIRNEATAQLANLPQFLGFYSGVLREQDGGLSFERANNIVSFSNQSLAHIILCDSLEVEPATLLNELADIFGANDENRNVVKAAFLLAALNRVLFVRNDQAVPLNFPQIVITSTDSGSGKTSLAQALANVASVTQPSFSYGHRDNQDELRKVIVAMALSGRRCFVLDNIARGSQLQTEILAAATTGTLELRLLGSNKVIAVRQPLFILTGLDLKYNEELGRRVLKIEQKRANTNETITLLGERMPRARAVQLLTSDHQLCSQIASALLSLFERQINIEALGQYGNFASLDLVNNVLEQIGEKAARPDIDGNISVALVREFAEMIVDFATVTYLRLNDETVDQKLLITTIIPTDDPSSFWNAEIVVKSVMRDITQIAKKPSAEEVILRLQELLNEAPDAGGQIPTSFSSSLADIISGAGLGLYGANNKVEQPVLMHRRVAYPKTVMIDEADGKIRLRANPTWFVEKFEQALIKQPQFGGSMNESVSSSKIVEFATRYPNIFRMTSKDLIKNFKSPIAIATNLQWLTSMANSLTDDEQLKYMKKKENGGRAGELRVIFSKEKFYDLFGDVTVEFAGDCQVFLSESSKKPLINWWCAHASRTWLRNTVVDIVRANNQAAEAIISAIA